MPLLEVYLLEGHTSRSSSTAGDLIQFLYLSASLHSLAILTELNELPSAW